MTALIILAASRAAVLTVWGVSLAIGVVVIGVVWILLALVSRTAARIEEGAAAIWTEGKLVANNTIQIPIFLHTAARVVTAIRSTAIDIVAATRAIEQHAEGCPGCPDCVLQARY